MARVAFVFHDSQAREGHNGFVARVVLPFARGIRDAGDEVTLVEACRSAPELGGHPARRALRREAALEWIEVRDDAPPRRWPDVWSAWLSERATPILRRFDVVYAADWANPAFHLVRTKRFEPPARPVCVTVLDGPSGRRLEIERRRPDAREHLALDFVERYAAAHGDFVVATSPPVLEWARREGWVLPGDPEALSEDSAVAGHPHLMAFHERVRAVEHAAIPALELDASAVDVCVTYYQKPRHFPALLESLERQTLPGFGVIAVDDGSPDPAARAAFDAMAARYRPRGWTFFRQENAWVDAARNRAAARSRADYLLMVDADDVLAPRAVERLLRAAVHSGDDCLVGGTRLFAGDERPCDLATGEPIAPPLALYHPLGPSLAAGLFEPAVFGGPVILIRRRVFEALGGYRELRGSAHEDWELHARLALAGYATDVVPEDLHYHRQVEDGLSRTADDFLAKRRMIETYDHHLAAIGLRGLAGAAYELQRRSALSRRRLGGSEPRPLESFAAAGDGPPGIRALRRVYRNHVSLERRLRLFDHWQRWTRSGSRERP